MAKATKLFEKGVVLGAKAGWSVFNKLNSISPNKSFTPKWSDKPLLKSYQKEKPPLGWPRTTDSLCPKCVPQIRQQIVDGKLPHEILLNEKVGEIKAQIIERDGQILMVKDCPIHGHFEDVMSIDTAFFKHLEEVFPGRDIRAHNDSKLHNHGTSTVTHGRGSVLTIDLTNRCNMMCDPCFMDANQVGFVHELTWDEIKTMLDNAVTIKPKRQMSVQFSGGEPTLSPYFLDAVAYARKVGYTSVQAATNGIEFAKSKEFSKAAAEAGLRYAYLQFDGIGNAPNSHRKVGNAFDVKLQAIHNLHEAGVDIVPVTCIINGINNEQVAASSSSLSTTPRRSTSSASSRSASPAAMKTSQTSAAWRSATRSRISRTTSRTRPASASPSATGSPSASCPPSLTGLISSTDPSTTGASSPAAAIPTAASAWRS
jgi:sulfatase maturation enzyme AslB (radical SAM superfamily)